MGLVMLRRFVLLILLFAMVGTGAELLLMKHTEGFWQLVPVFLIVTGLIVLGWHAIFGGAATVRVFQGTMTLVAISGVAGISLHYRGNVEFELEMYPSLSGLGLFWEAMQGATPALAPGTMTVLGLLGLAYTYGYSLTTNSKDHPTRGV